MATLFSGALEKLILRELNGIAENIVTKAKNNSRWDYRIPNAISAEPAITVSDGRYTVSITVDINEETGAPEARAFEYGSGIHATRGVAQKYAIVPRPGNKMLVFPLSRWPKFQPGLTNVAPDKNDVFHLPKVMHPGVAPKPFMKPAIESSMKSIRTRLLGAVSSSIRKTIAEINFQD